MNSPVDNSLNFLVPRIWSNPAITESTSSYAFDSFRESILILFEVIPLEGWIDVMTSLMNIAGSGLQSQQNASQWNAIFMLIFNLFASVIILTLFVTWVSGNVTKLMSSIIIQSFGITSGMGLLTTEQRQWMDLTKFINAQTPSQLPKDRPTHGFRAWCYERATLKDGWWSQGFTAIYWLHILVLM